MIKSKKIAVILIAVAGVVLAFVLGRVLAETLMNKGTGDDLIVKEVGSPKIVAVGKVARIVQVKSKKKQPAKPAIVDPFSLRLAVTSKIAAGPGDVAGLAGPQLEGIWYDTQLKAAFISGNVVTVGEDVLAWKVRKIYKDRVELIKQNELMTLKLEDIYEE